MITTSVTLLLTLMILSAVGAGAIFGLLGFLLAAMMCAAGSADRDAAYLREIRLAREAGKR